MTSAPITKDMTIGEVVQEHPAVIEVLQAAGIHCVGCHVAYHETLEQGFKGHGMNDENVSVLLEKMNQAVSEAKEELGKDFIITKKAASKLKEVLVQNKKENAALRVSIIPGGCSGFQYGMELDEKPSSEDHVIEEDGVKVLISPEFFAKLKGAKIDYVDSLQGGGFKITNPNVASSCGCGQSFH